MSRGLSGCRDHPRSRGVYYRQATAVRRLGGSSPLARGLLHDDRVLRDGPGIIPARAGFTSRRPPTGVPTRDHPRSRGVYHAEPGAKLHVGGSSPLARGLQWGPVKQGGRAGIIPARAGFTAWLCACRMGPRDHPRSRGVYWNPAIHDAKSNGSSPLARGLPAPAERPATGIADHPRSRGVYLWTLESSFAVAGSSPLARGLPGTYHAYGEVDRIIPARAGFT